MDSQTKKFYLKIGVAILVAAFLIYKSPKSPGSIYAPDMAFSRAYETYTDNNPRGTMLPVANTISKNALPSDELYQKEKSVIYSYNYTRFYKNTEEDKARAGAELQNPYEANEAVLARAKVVYDKQCAICHGEKGLGDGKLIIREDGSDGAYKAVPPKYSDRLVGMKDGSIFHSITYGKNLMGPHAAHVKADDRWKLVCYIKELGGLNGGATASAAAPADSTKK
jgi:mono/diheme cytochrome c family protein